MSMHPDILQLAKCHLVGNSVSELCVFVKTLKEGNDLYDQSHTRENQLLLENIRDHPDDAKQGIALTLVLGSLLGLDSHSD